MDTGIVAMHVLYRRKEEDTNMLQLIKLVYLCHGWMLGNYGEGLIDEPVEAWRYGPIVPSVYNAYKSFLGSPINLPTVDRSDKFSELQLALVDKVLETYQDYTARQLSALTHQTGTPWDVVYQDGKGIWNKIPNALIRDYYQRKLRYGRSRND